LFRFLLTLTFSIISDKTINYRRYDTGLKKPNKRIDVLDKLLSKQDYLVEGGFSLADVAVASYLLYVPQFFRGVDLSRWPSVVAYMKRCAEREAYGAAFGPNVQDYLVAACESMMEEDKKKLFGMF
jgi:glutathione S-transferase/alpha,alpha-trehalase